MTGVSYVKQPTPATWRDAGTWHG